jgi:hypothetical protein
LLGVLGFGLGFAELAFAVGAVALELVAMALETVEMIDDLLTAFEQHSQRLVGTGARFAQRLQALAELDTVRVYILLKTHDLVALLAAIFGLSDEITLSVEPSPHLLRRQGIDAERLP